METKNELKKLFMPFLSKTLADNYENFKSAGEKEKENLITKMPYFFMMDYYGYPKTTQLLWIIAKDASHYSAFNNILDTLAHCDLITSTHELTEYKSYSFANHTVSIELNQHNLNFLKNLYTESQEDNNAHHFLSSLETKLLQHQFESKNNELSVHTGLSLLKDTTKIYVYSKLESAISAIEPNQIHLYRYEGSLTSLTYAEKEKIVLDMCKLFLLVSPDQVSSFEHLFSMHNVEVEDRTDEIKLLKLRFAFINEVEVITKSLLAMIDSHLKDNDQLLQEINANIDAAQNLCNSFDTNLSRNLKEIYFDFYSKKDSEQQVILTMVNIDHNRYGIQSNIHTPYIQCMAGYILYDQLILGLRERLNKLIGDTCDLDDYQELMEVDTLLRRLSFYDKGYRQLFVMTDNEMICPAWEYGLNIIPCDRKLLKLYEENKGKVNKDAVGFLQIPLVNFALFILCEAALSGAQKDKIQVYITKARELILQFDPLIPKRYHTILFNGMDEDFEKKASFKNYSIHESQIQLRQNFLQTKVLNKNSVIEILDDDEVIEQPSKAARLTPLLEYAGFFNPEIITVPVQPQVNIFSDNIKTEKKNAI